MAEETQMEVRVFGPLGPVMQRMYDQEYARNGNSLEPGTEGWWPVWGARAIDIRPGDLVMSGWKDDDYANNGVIHHAEYEVVEMAGFKDPMMNTIRVGFIASNGKFGSVGMLQAMQLRRWGTHNTLADSI